MAGSPRTEYLLHLLSSALFHLDQNSVLRNYFSGEDNFRETSTDGGWSACIFCYEMFKGQVPSITVQSVLQWSVASMVSIRQLNLEQNVRGKSPMRLFW